MPTDVTTDLVRALIEGMRGAEEGWESLAIVVSINNRHCSGTSGYVYSPGGGIAAVASRPSTVESALHAYLGSHYAPDAKPPVKLLVQFDRTKGDYEITFEDTDTSRWRVTPANIDELPEQLRPRF